MGSPRFNVVDNNGNRQATCHEYGVAVAVAKMYGIGSTVRERRKILYTVQRNPAHIIAVITATVLLCICGLSTVLHVGERVLTGDWNINMFAIAVYFTVAAMGLLVSKALVGTKSLAGKIFVSLASPCLIAIAGLSLQELPGAFNRLGGPTVFILVLVTLVVMTSVFDHVGTTSETKTPQG